MASSFILIAKTLKGINLIANTPLKTFYTLYKMRWNVFEVMFNSVNRYISKIFVQQNLKLITKKPKSLKSKDFKKAVVFKRDSPNTRQSDRELKAQI
ncbi:hypothetical protein ACLGAD_00910 [Helicobacter pylori]